MEPCIAFGSVGALTMSGLVLLFAQSFSGSYFPFALSKNRFRLKIIIACANLYEAQCKSLAHLAGISYDFD
jgi:hypothetical protein